VREKERILERGEGTTKIKGRETSETSEK